MENKAGTTSGQRSRKDSTKTGLVLVIVVLLGIIGLLLYSNMQLSEELEVKGQQLEADSTILSSKTRELDELVLAYERIRMEREELGLVKDSLNDRIVSLNNFIAEVRKGNARAIRNMQAMITKLKVDLLAEDKEISNLKLERDSLKTNVKKLTHRTLLMKDSLDHLQSERSELAEKVAVASILKAERIKVTVINRKGKELDKEEYRSKNVEKIKVAFRFADNIVARKDNKNLVMRVIEPSGSVLFDLSTGGGFFNAEGKELPFTDKQVVKFDNTNQEVSFIYLKGSSYKPGNYTIELYSDGHKIGETDLQVK